jgi:hypothetical protein
LPFFFSFKKKKHDVIPCVLSLKTEINHDKPLLVKLDIKKNSVNNPLYIYIYIYIYILMQNWKINIVGHDVLYLYVD